MWALLICALVGVVILVRWRRSELTLIDYLGVGLVHAYARLWHGLVIRGPGQLPAKGAALLISNHSCSADPALLQACSPRPLGFLIAREYYFIASWARRLFEHMGCVSVTRNGRDTAALRQGLERLRAGRMICLFPEGSLSGAGRGRLRPGKGGAALLALRSRAPVFPAFIAGGPQHSHVARAWLFPSRSRIYVGQSVDLSAYHGKRINRALLEEVTALLMRHIAALDPHKVANGSTHRACRGAAAIQFARRKTTSSRRRR